MKFRYLAGALSLAFAGTAVGQTVLNVSQWAPPNHVLAHAVTEWCQLMDQESAGKLKCNILPKAVASPPGTYDAVRAGLADISWTVDGYTPGRFVFSQVAELPFLGSSGAVTSVAYQRIHDKHFAELNEHRGVKVLAVFTHGPGQIYNTKKPATTPADVASLKLRVGGGMVVDLSRAMGWNVTLKPSTEIYELLSTGVLDGYVGPIDGVKGMNLNMVKYGTHFPGGLNNTAFMIIMNPASYSKLKPEERKIIDKISGERAARMFGGAWDKGDVAGVEEFKAIGGQVAEASPELVQELKTKAAAQVEANWIKAAEAKGLKNAQAVLDEFRAEIAKVSKN